MKKIIKLFLAKQLLNVFKPWCEWGTELPLVINSVDELNIRILCKRGLDMGKTKPILGGNSLTMMENEPDKN